MMEEERESVQQNIHGDQNATSVYGDASVHIYPPPISSVLPEQVWMVPYRRNGFFTGRETLLKDLHERFTGNRAAVLTQGQAVNGLGGIGKTQVAVEYTYLHQEEYRFVLWASAASQETLLAAYVNIADRLQLPERNSQEQDKIVAAVKHWLATHEGWLLVMDNADELDMVWPMLPTGNAGHLLLTTRDQVVGSMESFVVEPMDLAEGTLLLLRRAHVLKTGMELEQIVQADRHIAEQIVVEMDGLPLALDQAGAYIDEAACSLEEYLQAYRQRRSLFLADRGRLASDHPASVATTWSLSFERVEQRNPAAADLLRVCAFLAPDAIPEELLTKGAIHLGSRLQSIETKPSLLQGMSRTLRAYSLVRRDPKEKTLKIHRLVQSVLQNTLEENERRSWVERAILAVNAAFPNAERTTWPQCERFVTQALFAADWIEKYQLIGQETGRLLYETASYLRDRASYVEAEPLYQRTLYIFEQQLGPEHLQVATALNGLAELYRRQGKYVEAEPLYQRALYICEQQLEPEPLQVASLLIGLAEIYYERGKYAEAEPLYQRALNIREQRLGSKHPQLASPLNGLAELYRKQGKYEQAKLLFQRAIHIFEQQPEPEPPEAAYPLSNLGGLLYEQGKYTEAEQLYQRALLIWEQQLGPEHPDLGAALNNLAWLYRELGKYTEAEQLYQRLLRIFEQRLGPERPQMAYPLNNLAEVYREQGRYAEAEPLFQRALLIFEQRLGPEHSQVAYPLHGLATLNHEQGKYAEAEPLYQRALAIREQQLGPNHPQVAFPLNNLALLYAEQAKYEQAKLLFQRALHIRKQALGPQHPETAETIHDLARFWEMQGNREEARSLYTDALVIRGQALGAHHPKTMTTRTRLITLLRAMGQQEEAAQLEADQLEM